MSLIRYNPWSLMDEWLDDRLSSKEDSSMISTSHWMPAVDIKNEKDKYVIYVDVPGVDPKNIEVTMEHNMLSIHGERTTESKENREGFSRIERISGSFYRRFSLPGDVDGEHVKAHSKQGVLVLEVPKRKQSMSRKIEIEEKK